MRADIQPERTADAVLRHARLHTPGFQTEIGLDRERSGYRDVVAAAGSVHGEVAGAITDAVVANADGSVATLVADGRKADGRTPPIRAWCQAVLKPLDSNRRGWKEDGCFLAGFGLRFRKLNMRFLPRRITQTRYTQTGSPVIQ